MSKRLGVLLIVLSVSLNLAFVAVWAVKSCNRGMRPNPKCAEACVEKDSCRVGCPLHRAIGTTDAQWQTLEPLQREFRAASCGSCMEISRLRAEMIVFLSEPTVNLDSVKARQEQILLLQKHMQELTVDHLLAEKKVLNAEQWSKLVEMMKQGGECANHSGLAGSVRGDRCESPTEKHKTGH